MTEKPRLPTSWTSATLEQVGDWFGGGTPNTGVPEYWEGGTIPWFSPKDMKCLRLTEAEDNITERATKQTNVKPFPKGVVLIVVRSGILSRTLPIGVSEVVGTMNQDLKGIHPSPGIEPYFIAYQLMSQERAILDRCCKDGTTVASIEVPRFRSYKVAIAPSNEQRRIVAKIEELFSDLDAGVAALERVRANLKRYRAAVLKAAVEGKLTEDWRAQHPDTEPASVLLDRILTDRRCHWEQAQLAKFAEAGRQPPSGWQKSYGEPVEPDLTDVPTFPESWCVAGIEQLTSTITSGSRDWSQYYGRGSGTFLMAQNVRMGRLDLSFRQAVDPPENSRDRARSQIEQGDILITIVGANTGDVCRAPSSLPEHYVCQSVALARPLQPAIARFVEAYMTSHDNGQRQFRRYIYGAGRPHLSFDQIKMTAVLLPPLEEQAVIVSEVERRLSIVDEIEAQVEAT